MEIDFSGIEKKILEFWKKNKIFEKSIKQRKKAGEFVFYEGPPTANGKPGIHHVLSRAYKDIICRYKTMQGCRVSRKAGWDTHGLPVELEVEKKLGLKSKKDIEKYGIAEFNKKCRQSVWAYKEEWEKLTERIAFWLDMENPYITYENNYIETVWFIIKQISQKGLLYKDYKVVPYCPRCGTSLSGHEVAQGYKKVKDPSAYIKMAVKNQESGNKIYLLVWTTTPWTLPGNAAVAVNPNFVYVKVKINDEYLILAKERMAVCGIENEIVQEFKGKEILGLEYETLYQAENGSFYNRVVAGDFVSLEEGTGLVHIAPAFGEEDMEVGKKNDLPVILNVDESGKFKKEVKNWAGFWVKDADPLIVEDLKKRNLLFKEELYEHDYPFCWRCGSPLLYYAKQSWFIKMQAVKNKLINNNQKVNWVPAHLKKGRFGEWLQELKDWAFSRERYWGTPLPVWQCKAGNSKLSISDFQANSKHNQPAGGQNQKQCGHIEVIGSLNDLLKQNFTTNNYYLFRHGHSERQITDLISCWPEKKQLPLTEKGEKQILKSIKKFKNKKIDLIFSSDLLRTKQTAGIIAEKTGAEIIFDRRLRENDMGELNGRKVKEAGKFWDKDGISRIDYYLKRFEIKAPKGENYIDVQKRMYCFLKEINEKYQNKNIVIVSHELPLTVLEAVVKGLSRKETIKFRDKFRLETGNCRKIPFKIFPYNEKQELDFHRPYIDEVKFHCLKCGGIMERTPEVIDCWFDSGSMPFAQDHWPFSQDHWPFSKASAGKQNQKLAPYRTENSGAGLQPLKLFPADYISEAIDQTRGWFYTLLAISTLLGFGAPYKNVISQSHVLDEKGEKMSKSKGNIVNPWQVVEKYGADAVRWYFFTVNQPGDPKLFSERDIEQVLKRFILTLWNSLIFFETYQAGFVKPLKHPITGNVLDKWIISKINSLVRDVACKLDNYDVTGAARIIESFTVEDLSQWYIRRSRRRFQKPKTKKELNEASQTLGFALSVLSRTTAPFMPFLSEEINQRLNNKRSVHLEDWAKVNAKMTDKKLEDGMAKIREIVALSLAERAKNGIKVRQPLQKLKIKNQPQPISNELGCPALTQGLWQKLKINKELLELIKDEVNVKEIIFDGNIKNAIELDVEITPELKEEGIIREIIRNIQEMRKMIKLKPGDEIKVKYYGTEELNRVLSEKAEFILKEAKLKDLIQGEKIKETFAAEREIKIDQEKLWLAIVPSKSLKKP